MRRSAPLSLLLTASLAAGPIFAKEEAGGKPPHFPPFEISVSRVANLVHWIDNLAGSSRGKTIRTYRRYWQRRFGGPTPSETDLLRRWSEIRYKPEQDGPLRPLNERGCLPQVEDPLPWRHVFLLRSYEAPSVEAFLEALSDHLDGEEIRELEEIIDAFEPRFDKVWRSMGFLRRFEGRFRRYLEQSDLRPFLGEVARFLEVDPGAFPPGRIHLMALPQESATFATAIGRDLMMEIRPGDGPREQIQVIAHETTHYLWQMIPPDRMDDLARQVHAASSRGAVVWALLREGLPTAVGQGLAEARLAPGRFGFQYAWYHMRHIDRFAKEIYPLVERGIASGGTFAESMASSVGRIPSGSMPVPHAPGEHLVEAVHLLGEETLPAYARVMQRNPARHRWVFRAGDPAAGEMLERFQCLGGLAFVGPAEAAEPSRLPELFRAALVQAPAASSPEGDEPQVHSAAGGEGASVRASPRSDPPTEGGEALPADSSSEGEDRQAPGPRAGELSAAEGGPPEASPGGGENGTGPDPPLRSGIHVLRRPAGGLLIVLVAARSKDVIPVADLYLGLRRVPDGPVRLPAASP